MLCRPMFMFMFMHITSAWTFPRWCLPRSGQVCPGPLAELGVPQAPGFPVGWLAAAPGWCSNGIVALRVKWPCGPRCMGLSSYRRGSAYLPGSPQTARRTAAGGALSAWGKWVAVAATHGARWTARRQGLAQGSLWLQLLLKSKQVQRMYLRLQGRLAIKQWVQPWRRAAGPG